jgi:hypothetical protein
LGGPLNKGAGWQREKSTQSLSLAWYEQATILGDQHNHSLRACHLLQSAVTDTAALTHRQLIHRLKAVIQSSLLDATLFRDFVWRDLASAQRQD